jgi:coenzyme F420-reducing hydrogenase delta subunit
MLGFEKGRILQEFISAAEFPKFARVINEMVADVKQLGPSPLGQKRQKPISVENISVAVS